MKRYLLLLTLGGAALLAPSRARAQEKPVLNTAPTVPRPIPVAPAPTRPAPAADTASNVAPTIPVYTPGQAPVPAATPVPTNALPTPSYGSPSGFDLPEREQKRQALQQHAEQYTKFFVYTGAGFSLGSVYGATQFNISASPAIGYRLSDRLAVGPGISYAYNSTSFGGNYPSLHLNNIGVKIFGQYIVYKQFFIHAEYEVTKAERPLVDQNNQYVILNNKIATGTVQVTSPLAGAGYRSQLSNRIAADIVLLYNFKDDYNSIYINPVIRFNFLFNIGR